MTQDHLFSRSTMLVVSLICSGLVSFYVSLDSNSPSFLLLTFVCTFLLFAAFIQFIRYNFRLGLRSLLLLMTVSCVVLGFVGRRAFVARRQFQAVSSIIGFDNPWTNSAETRVDYKPQPTELADDQIQIYNGLVVPQWVEELAPKDFLYDVQGVQFSGQDLSDPQSLAEIDLEFFDSLIFSICNIGDSIDRLASLKRVKTLYFWDCVITDSDIAILSKLEQLETLYFIRRNNKLPSLTDESANHIAKLKSLKFLSLAGSDLGGEGLAKLSQLQEIQVLDLSGTQVSNDDMQLLLNFPELKSINLADTQVDEAAIPTLLQLKGEVFVRLTASSDEERIIAEDKLANEPVSTGSNIWIEMLSPAKFRQK